MSVSSDSATSSSDTQSPFEAAPSQEAPPREDRAPTESSPTVLPIPIGKLRSDLTPAKDAQARPSFWRRIAFRKRKPEISSPGSETEISARLEAIERALEQFAGDVHGQLEVLTGDSTTSGNPRNSSVNLQTSRGSSTNSLSESGGGRSAPGLEFI